MSRTIVLPSELENRLHALTSLREETNGVLLYRREENLCPVEGIYITGVGSEGHVQADPNKVKIVNRFFEVNPDYKFIKFHTHTAGTIAKFGEQYAREFSEGDIAGIKEQFKHNPEFIAMLITPETQVLSGLDNPQLEIVEHSEIYEKQHRIIGLSLERVATSLGIENERFRGVKIK